MKTIEITDRRLAPKTAKELRTKREWEGGLVRATGPIGTIAAGTLFEVVKNFRGLHLHTLPTECCGSREDPHTKVAQTDVEYLGHPLGADGRPLGRWMASEWFARQKQRAPRPRPAAELKDHRVRIRPTHKNEAELEVLADAHGPWARVGTLSRSGTVGWWYYRWSPDRTSAAGATVDAHLCAGVALERIDGKLLRTRRRPWIGAVVQSLRGLGTRAESDPAGTFYLVTDNHGGLEMRTLACRTCEHTHTICKVPETDVRYLGHVRDTSNYHRLYATARTMRANGRGPAAAPTFWRPVEDDGPIRIETRGSAERWTPTATIERDARDRIRIHTAEGVVVEPE